MEIAELEIVELELKYCETCGGLWMREHGEDSVQCPACRKRLARYPFGGGRQLGPRREDA